MSEAEELKKQQEVVQEMVEQDEWNGITVHMQNLVSAAVVEDLKAKAKDFLSMDRTHKLRNVTHDVQKRVLEEVNKMRAGEVSVGDVSRALVEKTKTMAEELTGKAYEVGELSVEIDTKIKRSVADYAGKEEYETGDLTRLIKSKAKSLSEELQANHKFQEIARVVNERRMKWITDILGEEAAKNYKFGDIYKSFAMKYTGMMCIERTLTLVL